MRTNLKWISFLILISVIFSHTTYAAFSASDKKNKVRLEKEIGQLHVQIKDMQTELKKTDDSEWKAYMKDAKSEGKARSDKFNNARDLYEVTAKRRKDEMQYYAMKGEYESTKARLDQLEWELAELKKKEKQGY